MKIEWKQCFCVGISVFILFLCIHYWESAVGVISLMIRALSPIILGMIMAYLVNILMSVYEKYYFKKYQNKRIVIKSKRPVCMIFAMATLVGIAVLLVEMILPELISSCNMLVERIPSMMSDLFENPYVKRVMPNDLEKEINHLNWQTYMEKVIRFLFSGIGGAMNTVAEVAVSLFSMLVTGVVGFIFSIYFLIEKEKLQSQCIRIMRSYLKSSWCDMIMYYFSMLNECFHQYIVGKCIDAVIIGVMCAAGMAVFQFPYAALVGTLVGFTALIPIAGAYIGAVIGAFMILTISPIQAVMFLIFIVVLQQLEGNLIYPKIMGSSVGLPAVWVLAAVTVGGCIAGVMGMLIGVPIVAAIYRIVKEDVVRREKIKNL